MALHQSKHTCLVLQIADMAKLVHLIIRDNLHIEKLHHICHIPFTADKNRDACPRIGYFGSGSKLKNHVFISVFCTFSQDICKRNKITEEFVHTIGIIPHKKEIFRGGLHGSNTTDGFIAVDDPIRIGIFGHTPHAFYSRITDQFFHQIHIRACRRHGNGDHLHAERLRHFKMSVVSRGRAEPLYGVKLCPRLAAVLQAMGVGFGNGVIHQLQRRITADKNILRLYAENLGKQFLAGRKPIQIPVIAGIDPVTHIVTVRGEDIHHLTCQVKLLFARLAPCHIERKALSLQLFVFRFNNLQLGLKLFCRHICIFFHYSALRRMIILNFQ